MFYIQANKRGAGFYLHGRAVDRDRFRGQLVKDPARAVVGYIHGFNTKRNQALSQGEELQDALNRILPRAVRVIPIIWPCGQDFFIGQRYFRDKRYSKEAAKGVSEGLPSLLDLGKPAHLVLFSMGNRAGREGFARLPDNVMFDSVNMFAADLPCMFKEEKVGQITSRSRDTFTYWARSDRAMSAGQVANVFYDGFVQRMGAVGPRGEGWPASVGSVDCTGHNEIDVRYGHQYFHTGLPAVYLAAVINGWRPDAAGMSVNSVIDTLRLRAA